MFGKVDLEKLKKFGEKIMGNITTFWVPEEGSNLIRFLPPVDSDLPFEEVRIHFFKNRAPMRCLRDFGKQCPICDISRELSEKDDPNLQDLGNTLSARRRFLFYIIDLNAPEEGPQIYPAGIRLLSQFIMYMSDPEWGDLTDPQSGFDCTLEKIGSGINTQYILKPKRTPTPIELPTTPLKKLSDCFPEPSEEDIQEATQEIQEQVQNVGNNPVSNIIEDAKKLLKNV